jgi:Fibronectin type III domain
MPSKDNPKTEEQKNDTPESARGSDMHRVLNTLDQVFSTFRTQLKDEAPKAFDGAAKVAVDTFNDIVAGLKFKTVPSAVLNLTASPLSLTEIGLAWTDNTLNTDGYTVERCQGQYCSDLVEIRQLSPSARSFTDSGLSGNTTYRYQIVAFNSRGETPSQIVSATTTATPLQT